MQKGESASCEVTEKTVAMGTQRVMKSVHRGWLLSRRVSIMLVLTMLVIGVYSISSFMAWDEQPFNRNSISSGSPHGTGDQSGSDGGRGGNRAQRSARSSISRSRTPSESSEVSEKEREREAKERLLWDPVRDARNAGNAIAGKPDRVEENDEYYDDQEAHRDADRDENLDTDRDDTAHDVSSSPLPTLHTDNHHRVDTLFSKMSTSFMDIKLETDGGIPVAQFLDSCENVLIIFDKLSPTAFAPIKMDISRNARKIRQKYSTDTTKFATLQMIINYEVEHSQDGMEQSATISLIWLKRAMMFIREFLAEVHTGSLELEDCAYNAYQRTLRHFHGFVIRGVFAVAVKSVPFRKDFLVALLHLPEDAEQPGYQEVVLKDMEDYITAQGVLIKIIDDYLTSMHIDHKTIV